MIIKKCQQSLGKGLSSVGFLREDCGFELSCWCLPCSFFLSSLPSYGREITVLKPPMRTVKSSGRIHEFFSNMQLKLLWTKNNLIIYSTGLNGLPARTGKIKDLSKFDASFFGVHAKQAEVMDPQLRMLLEATYEALIDAGRFYIIIRNGLNHLFL